MLVALKTEKWDPELRMQVASKTWKRQGNAFAPGASRKNAAMPKH